MITAELLPEDRDLLLGLLETPTAGPLERGGDDPPPELWRAQRAYAAACSELGFTVERHGPPTADEMHRDDVPEPVRRAVHSDPAFLESQPSLVLRLGSEQPREATIMFNVHLDTVAGHQTPGFDGRRFQGRGAIDAKGPAVALVAGIRAALAAEPRVTTGRSVLIQAVAGEEGGVMGTIGTRPLIERGYVGRLNVFCEPTGLRYLPRATASMTARIRVDGDDAIDDRPERGHNASVLLGFLAQHLAGGVTPGSDGTRMCIAGLRTGPLHNRVYGAGELLVNLAYDSTASAQVLEDIFTEAVHEGLQAFSERFVGVPTFRRTAEEAASVTHLEWIKRGLPALEGADPACERLLEHEAGLARWPDEEPAFTCDAIWMHGVTDAFTVVCGPGDLAGNNAHADGEFADVASLEAFATVVARLLVAFSRTGSRERRS